MGRWGKIELLPHFWGKGKMIGYLLKKEMKRGDKS
jgi:hypothetical protein